ncbi:MAG: aminotransferase class IV [Planctomycetes bacterium]|nr:aminotransferase class IV [Planctomycetota bacterium]
MWYEYCYFDGHFIKINDANINISSEGVLFGYGVFDTLKLVKAGSPFLKNHFLRFKNHSDLLKIPVSISFNNLQNALTTLWMKNKKPDIAIAKISIIKGKTDFHTAILLRKYDHNHLKFWNGVEVTIAKKTTDFANINRLKTCNYLDNLLSRIKCKNSGCFETIYFNYAGYLTEGTACNIFFVSKNNSVITTPLSMGILNGVTRQTVLRILNKKMITTLEKPIRINQINQFKEMFLTNSVYEVIPVKKLRKHEFKVFSTCNLLRREFSLIWNKNT